MSTEKEVIPPLLLCGVYKIAFLTKYYLIIAFRVTCTLVPLHY